jgi:methylenetetrahydrofolate--tRNA-(uracil-5-)-methyltransferase
VTVIGGGLAGSEAAWQAAQLGLEVVLYEMRPVRMTAAHLTDQLAELVCSNSLGSNIPDRAPGLLKAELRRLGSLVLTCADATAVPAGGALAVDRVGFAQCVTSRIAAHPRIHLYREEIGQIPSDRPVVIATGPLTSPSLAAEIAALIGSDYLYFYDAMAPIVAAESVDMSVAFRANRYDHGTSAQGDYINCPMTESEYDRFVQELLRADTITLHDFEREDPKFFEACLPVEALARRGRQALAFGPLKPVGLTDPRTGRRPYAVVQLRQDNVAASLYNMVGFQTNLTWGEQERVFRLIPGLQHAEFVRFGQMHRNTFINSPALLLPTLQFRGREDLFFAGQITGTEGYVGSVASGWLAGLNAARVANGVQPLSLPLTTMIGSLCHYVSSSAQGPFQPMKANFGLLPPLDSMPRLRGKGERHGAYARRALDDLELFIHNASLDSHLHSGGTEEQGAKGVPG